MTEAVVEGQPDWLDRRANDIGGLDHLGVAAVSEHLYGGLVPGLTNVTERARYFAFYPWVLHRFAQEPPAEHSGRAWRQWIRRLDCAYGLAAIAHAHDERAVVGAKNARRVLGQAAGGGAIRFHAFADLNEKGGVPRSGSYFLNPEGGFGQYYKGPLVELGVLCKTEEHRDPAHQITTYCGLALAQALDANPGFKELRELASSGSATVSDLTALGSRIGPSAIEEGGAEEQALRRLFFGEDDQLCRGQTRESREWRRGSLLLGLKFVRDVGPVVSSTFAEELRWACANESLPDGRRWSIPASLAGIVESWRGYHRHDLLSFALGVMLEACVQLLEDPMPPRDLAATIAEHACAENPNAGGRFVDLVAASGQDEASTRQILDLTSNADEPGPRVSGALRLLARLANEHAGSGDRPFGSVPVAASATAFEVQLGSWIQRVSQRGHEPARQFVEALVLEWVIHRHLRVATLKLAYDWKSTFKFRPDEGVLRALVDDPPPPILTNPRLRQARQVLEDLHLLRSTDGNLSLSADGQRVLAGVS